MAVSTRARADGFRAIVGTANAHDDPARCAAAALDGMVPSVIVSPGTTEETAAVVALAAIEGLATAPRGSGAALDQGAPPARLDLVLDLSRLDRIVEYNADDLTVTAEAGVTAATLAATLAAHRQALPIDPPGGAARTLGGLVATNASGPLRARYGTVRDLLLGVRFVQADGIVTWGGSKVVKSVTGYDVPKLMVGALGTLGVLTELTFRLYARPDVERTSLVRLRDLDAVQMLVGRILDSSLQPNRLEVLDAPAMAAMNGQVAPGVAVSFGSVEEAVLEQEAEVGRLARDVGAVAITTPDALWPLHERVWRRDAAGTLLAVGSLPARLTETFEGIARAASGLGHGARVLSGGCGVVGSLRVSIARAPASAVVAFIERLRHAVGAWGGTVTVQGAPREVRASVDPWGPVSADALAVMRAIKTTFDPDRRLNPGRFVGGL